jgi:hypothetical protein
MEQGAELFVLVKRYINSGHKPKTCPVFDSREDIVFRDDDDDDNFFDIQRCLLNRPMVSFWTIKIDEKCKHLSSFPAVTLQALW